MINLLSSLISRLNKPAINDNSNQMRALNQENHNEKQQEPHNRIRDKFWEKYGLDELNHLEWEALCDGCGGCCLEKFLDPDESPYTVEYTDVACRLLDCETGYCSDYANRKQFVPACVTLTPDKLAGMMWLPNNCAYKRLFLGQGLPDWHLLITQDAVKTQQGMRQAGVGVAGRCISETQVNEWDLEDRIVRWIQA